jgi:hypothetical protein
MKKIYLTLGLGFLILGASAQQKVAKSLTAESTISLPVLAFESKTSATSTLSPVSLTASGCAATGSLAGIAMYSNSPDPGYLFGTNTFTVLQQGFTFTLSFNKAAQKYAVTGTGVSVTNVLVLAGKAKSNAATSLVTCKIYSEDLATKSPSVQIGVASTKALSSFTTGSTYNVFTFGTPVPLSAGNFFASVEAPALGGATNDTLGIYSTRIGCSSIDTLAWFNTTVIGLGQDLGWSSVKAGLLGNTSDLDLAIFPVIDISTGLNSVSKGNLTLLAAFPNPANNDITINFGLNQSSKVEIEIYDVTGKMVNSIKLDNLEAGNHSSKINTSNLNAGVYMYSVKSDNAKMFSKFTIAK